MTTWIHDTNICAIWALIYLQHGGRLVYVLHFCSFDFWVGLAVLVAAFAFAYPLSSWSRQIGTGLCFTKWLSGDSFSFSLVCRRSDAERAGSGKTRNMGRQHGQGRLQLRVCDGL
jgi:hypothetical protein